MNCWKKQNMKIKKIEKNIIKIIVESKDLNIDEYYSNLIFLESKNILTSGDTNFRTFGKFFVKKGYNPEQIDLCFDDDVSIGLEMPKTSYLNKGKHALSIACYYNYLNFQELIESKDLKTFNKKISDKYGRIACIEIYFEKELKEYFDLHKIKYFGTPRTLTECMRYLEGWDIKEYPRLKGYATFSKFIELWSKINFPYFNADEWYLGKEKSNQINKTGKLTNVRSAIRYFWENYLLKQHRYLCDEDIEIDVLGGEKFNALKQPRIVLLSEDLFSEKNSNFEIFQNLTARLHKDKVYISKLKNNFPKKNAQIAKKLYPNSLIILIENDKNLNRNFSLMNPIKQAVTTDVIIATKILKFAITNCL